MSIQSRSLATRDECEPGIFMPVDPLTRLIMDADNVSASEMEELMRRVSRSLAKPPARRGGAGN